MDDLCPRVLICLEAYIDLIVNHQEHIVPIARPEVLWSARVDCAPMSVLTIIRRHGDYKGVPIRICIVTII